MDKLTLNLDWIQKKPLEKKLACAVDCCQLFAYLKTLYQNCYFFESLGIPRHQDRYFTIGYDPCLIFSAKGQMLTLSGKSDAILKTTEVEKKEKVVYQTPNPYVFLREKIHFERSCNAHQGGLIGYFCHEAVNYFESSIQLEEHEDFSAFKLGLYTDGLIYDTTTDTLSYYSFHGDRSDLAQQLIEEAKNYIIPQSLKDVTFNGNSVSQSAFIEAVKKTKEKIKSGHSFQAEVGFKSYYMIEGDKYAIYNRLRQVNPGPYMYYLKFGAEELLGASPEILISCKQRYVLTTPTAGTTIRSKDKNQDTQLARELLNDPKEIAEHNMLVDLHRNDLSRVCQPGSVAISDLMYIIKFSHVQHIVSNIIGILREDKTAFDALECILPGGVVTGAPKIETIKIINENEKTPRGPYGGAVGRFSFNGDCEFCLPIRSIFCADNKCYAQTSAGVVYDSVPEKEYAEVMNKLAAMKQTLEDLGAHS